MTDTDDTWQLLADKIFGEADDEKKEALEQLMKEHPNLETILEVLSALCQKPSVKKAAAEEKKETVYKKILSSIEPA